MLISGIEFDYHCSACATAVLSHEACTWRLDPNDPNDLVQCQEHMTSLYWGDVPAPDSKQVFIEALKKINFYSDHYFKD